MNVGSLSRTSALPYSDKIALVEGRKTSLLQYIEQASEPACKQTIKAQCEKGQ